MLIASPARGMLSSASIRRYRLIHPLFPHRMSQQDDRNIAGAWAGFLLQIASMLMPRSARMRVTSANTPGDPCACKRR
jgi:hypothetical protein